jgi:hypothetical protein
LAQDLVGQGIQLVLPLFFGFLDRVGFFGHGSWRKKRQETRGKSQEARGKRRDARA